MADYDGLSPKQVAAIQALTTARTIGEAAKEAGVNRSTLNVWLKEDETFRLAYRTVKAAAFEAVAYGLLQLGEDAVRAYRDALEGPGIPGAATLSRTADSIVSQLFKLKDLTDFEDRLAAIEARIGGLPDGIGK